MSITTFKIYVIKISAYRNYNSTKNIDQDLNKVTYFYYKNESYYRNKCFIKHLKNYQKFLEIQC